MRTSNHRRLYGSLVVLGCLTCFSLPALSQGQGQGQNRGHGQDQRADPQLQDFVTRLARITDDAERARTAKPAVIKSLRDLAAAYGAPAARTSMLHDDFRDGDYTQNPAWQVAEGEFWVDSQGLRSRAKAAAAPAAQQSSNDATAALLGMVLTRMTQPQGATQQAAAAPAKPTPAVIFIPAAIANAFDMTVQVSVLDGAAPFLFGPYQGTDRRSGYRLIYKPSPENTSGTLELVRLAARGNTAAGQTSAPVYLEGAAPHVIGWSRTREGEMTVSVDGKEVMRTTDANVNGAFSGLMMANLGGDYAVREISIDGAK